MNSTTVLQSIEALLLGLVENDLNSIAGDFAEFPITRMSRTLADAVAKACGRLEKRSAALDVGTGSGVHSFQMAACGFERVDALDICETAVDRARGRWDRIASSLGGDLGSPNFIHSALVDYETGDSGQYDLITFNPPAYFSRKQVDFTQPLETGLFTGAPELQVDRKNPLHDFFAALVQRRLSPNGIAICTWPAVQQRNVVDPNSGALLHPAAMLKRRFGWEIEGVPDEDAAAFYSETSPMSYAEPLADQFMKDLVYCLEHRIYSQFVRTADYRFNARPSFAYGLVALRRDSLLPNRFSWLDLRDHPDG